jgi:tRNA dimethylallyltransferase
MRSVNYRQVWEYLDGSSSYDLMREKAVAATRQLAKRQMTWLRSFTNQSLANISILPENLDERLAILAAQW